MDYAKMAAEINKLSKSEGIVTDLLTGEVTSKIALWAKMYKNKAPWVNGSTIISLNLPRAISSEIAQLITIESKIEITGSVRAKFLDKQFNKVKTKLRKYVEYGVAKGGLVFKPYVSGNALAIQFVQADSFYPLSFDDNDNVDSAIFVDQFVQGKFIYTRLERHALNNGQVTIANRAFRSMADGFIGSEISLQEVNRWSSLQQEMVVGGIDRPLFGYYRFASASADFDKIPIGSSCFANAVNLIQEADRRYSGESWEFEAKEAAVNVSKNMLVYDHDTDSYQVPEGRDRLYRKFDYDTGAVEKKLLDAYSPDIRQEAYSKGINDQLRKVEFACGLAYGTLSDPQSVDKTAEEIKASKQRSYAMVSDNQKVLQDALDDLITAMDVYTSLYQLMPLGSYEVKFDWDDSIVSDQDKERIQDIQDVQMGIMQPWEYRKKYYGETDKQAKAAVTKDDGLVLDDGEE